MNLCGLRQPQATKHLQTLERVGLAVSRRSGQRRIYALEIDAIRSLIGEFTQLADMAAAHHEDRELFDRYVVAVESETREADRDKWADGREYSFRRVLPADRATSWEHLTDAELLRRWWTTRDLRLDRMEFGTEPGHRVVQEYVDASDRRSTAAVIGRAEGRIGEVVDEESIAFHLSPLLPDGTVAFIAHYEWRLSDAPGGTAFDVTLRISASTAPAAEFIAGIRLGWNQSLDNLAALVSTTATSAQSTDTTKEHA